MTTDPACLRFNCPVCGAGVRFESQLREVDRDSYELSVDASHIAFVIRTHFERRHPEIKLREQA